MKLFKTTILFGGLVALAASLSAETPSVQVNVPFSFVAGGYTLPAGSYTIEESNMHGVLLLRGSEPNSTAMVLAANFGTSYASHADLKFDRRGTVIVLSTIDIPGGSTYQVVAPQDRNATALSVRK